MDTGPKQLIRPLLPSQVHFQEAGSKEKQLCLIWNTSMEDGSPTGYATTLPAHPCSSSVWHACHAHSTSRPWTCPPPVAGVYSLPPEVVTQGFQEAGEGVEVCT